MERRLRSWQGKDQPIVSSVYGCKSEDVAKEGTVGLRVFGVDYEMRAANQPDTFPFSFNRCRPELSVSMPLPLGHPPQEPKGQTPCRLRVPTGLA